jgi:hypothetical protein
MAAAFTVIMYFVTNYTLSQQNANNARLIPEEAYLVILHDVYNKSLSSLSNITFDNLIGKFTSQYVMIDGNGTIYRANPDTLQTNGTIGRTDSLITSGSHFGWEITANNSKYYVDSSTGQIISIVKPSVATS